MKRLRIQPAEFGDVDSHPGHLEVDRDDLSASGDASRSLIPIG